MKVGISEKPRVIIYRMLTVVSQLCSKSLIPIISAFFSLFPSSIIKKLKVQFTCFKICTWEVLVQSFCLPSGWYSVTFCMNIVLVWGELFQLPYGFSAMCKKLCKINGSRAINKRKSDSIAKWFWHSPENTEDHWSCSFLK